MSAKNEQIKWYILVVLGRGSFYNVCSTKNVLILL